MLLDEDEVDPAASAAVNRGLTVPELIAWADTLEPTPEVNRAGLLTSISAFLGYAGRTDDAVAVLEEAVEDGGEVVPDVRLYLGSALLEIGDETRAGALFDAVRRERPTDPLVYELVGESWEEHGELATAEHWFTTGWRRCLTGPQAESQWTDHLLVCRRRARLAQGLVADELDLLAEEVQRDVRQRHAARGPLVIGFVPQPAWQDWPLARPPGTSFHEQVALLEGAMRSLSAYRPVRYVALDVPALMAFAAETRSDPRDEATLSAYLDSQQALGVPWPPGRNEACWCGSGRKYKKCCGRPANDD